MAFTNHTGIPRALTTKCRLNVSITCDLNPFCAGATVTFTPTISCVGSQLIASYEWIVNESVVSTSVTPYSTNTLVDNDVVFFRIQTENFNYYYSNAITMVEQTEGC